MSLSTVLMITVVPIVSLIVVIVVVVGSTEINQYKGLITQKVKEATGLDMRIEGDLDLTGSLSPTVVAEEVSFANAPWGQRPQMVMVKRFEAKVALIPLLRGDLQVKRLTLVEPDIFVETDARGHGNWEFFGLMMTQKPKQPAEADDGGTLALDIAEVQIEKGRLTFRNGVSGQTVTLSVNNFSARSDSFDHPIALDLVATFKGRPIIVTGTLGAFKKLLKNESHPVDLAVKAGNTKVNVKGSVASAIKGKGVNIAFRMDSKSLSDLSWLAGTDLPKVGPIQITAKVSEEKGVYMVKDLKTAVGKSDLSGEVKVVVGGTKPKVSAHLASNLIDLTDVPPTNPLPALKALLSAGADGTFKAKYIHAPGMALKQVDAALNPKSGQQRANLALTMKADSLADLSRLAGTDLPAFGPFSITAKVSEEKEAYTVKDFKVTVGNSDLSGEVKVALGGKRPNVSARLASVLIDFLDFMPASGVAPEENTSGEKLIFPATELPLDALRWADADVTLKAKYVHAPGVTLKQVNVAPSLKGGRLRVKQAKAQLAGGTVSADMTMDARSKTAKLSTQLDAKEVEVGRLLEQVDLTDVMSGGRTDVKIDLNSRGNSVRELMAKLNGRMLVAMGESRIHNSVANVAAPDLLLEIFHMMNPFTEKDEYTSLRCGVVLFDVKDGIATTDKGIGAETSKMNLIGSGA
ncbi:MAG: AsmA family protein, partial [Candidatus Binatia bacterium]